MIYKAYDLCIMICMRTTLIIDDELYSKAKKSTGVAEKTRLVHMGLEALIKNRADLKLAKLYGAIHQAKAARRRRF